MHLVEEVHLGSASASLIFIFFVSSCSFAVCCDFVQTLFCRFEVAFGSNTFSFLTMPL